MPDFDLIALGSGTAAMGVAMDCRKAGWRVAMVEAREFGGTCALRGCEPKKLFWTFAEAADAARRLAPHGLRGGAAVGMDWPAVQRFKHGFTDPVPQSRRDTLREAGIEPLEGEARFVAPDAVAVAGRSLSAKHILIATGASPAVPKIEGAALLSTSDDYLSMTEVPARLVLLGGGYISFECAHIAARAGAAVTILHANDHPLAQFDQDLVARLVAHSRHCGIDVRLGCKATALRREAGGLVVECEDGARFTADMVVHGLGRRPALQGLDLPAGGVAEEKGRLVLDRHLRSASNPRVFAAGDAAAQGPALTPVATHDAQVVAANLLEGCHREPDYRDVPSVVFTIPPMASVGLTEDKARQQGVPHEVRQGDMAGYQSVRRTGHDTAAFKLLLEPGGGRVLGAHLLGPGAEETINLFAFALRFGVPARELATVKTAYPSAASNIASMME
jgi:glutathione reductase (NADPH)